MGGGASKGAKKVAPVDELAFPAAPGAAADVGPPPLQEKGKGGHSPHPPHLSVCFPCHLCWWEHCATARSPEESMSANGVVGPFLFYSAAQPPSNI